jgi:TRAP-type C4-dicarboxylate transport system permease small subunit
MRIVLGWVQRIDRGMVVLEKGSLVLLLTTMIALSFLQVLMRNFFDSAIPNGDVINRHLVLWVAFLGASLAASRRRHIRIELLTRILTGRARDVVETLLDLATAGVCFLFTKASWRFVLEEKEFAGDLFTGVPIWVTELIIPIGFLLLTFRFALQAVVRTIGTHEEASS